jgi:alpha-beta hydrolase superfamily lysophospholipase
MLRRYQISGAGRPPTTHNEIAMTGSEGFRSDGMLEARAAASGGVGGAAAEAGSSRAELTEGFSDGVGGVRLYHCEFVPKRSPAGGAVIALMHGYAEHCRRYDELATELAARGHVVCLFDARGHGRSGGQRGYVHAFGDYVADYAAFVRRVRGRHGPRPLIAMGHSNGGLIALRAVQSGLDAARGLVLTGPLLGLPAARKAVPDAMARALSALLPRLPAPNGIRTEDLMHDPVLREAHRRDGHVFRVATARWYWEMTLAARAALADAERVTLPLLIVQGAEDSLVDRARVAEFHARAGAADKQLVLRPGELHEVLNETQRRRTFDTIAEWIERVATA